VLGDLGAAAAATRTKKPQLATALESDRQVAKQVLQQKLVQFEEENSNLQQQIDSLAAENFFLRSRQQELEEAANREEGMAAAPILDGVLVPKFFSGNGEEDAIEWADFFKNYVLFRRLEYDDVKRLLPLFLKGCAAEWWSGLGTKPTDLDALVTAFKAKFKPSGATKWRSRSELWHRQQNQDERVGPYIEAMKADARRLGLDDDTTMWSIINGLKEEIRPSVIERNPQNLGELKDFAELSESARCMSGSGSFATALKRIESRLDNMAVSSVNAFEQNSASSGGGYRRYAPRGRYFGGRRFDDRRDRRGNGDRNSWSGQGQWTRSSTPTRPSGEEFSCIRCGRQHRRMNECRALDIRCHFCNARGHMQRMCRKRQSVQGTRTRSQSASPRSSPDRNE
jgi:hypothetical protein